MGNLDSVLWELLNTIAQHSGCHKKQVACLVYNVKTGEIVARGYNEHRDGVCDCLDKPGVKGTAVHAEVMAMTDLSGNENKDDLIAYVTHKPCCNCASALDNYVREVRYRSQHVS